MIHAAEHISLGVAYHAEDFNLVMDRAFKEARPYRDTNRQSNYLRPFLRSVVSQLADRDMGQITIKSTLAEVPARPLIRIPGEESLSSITELCDLAIFVEYIDGGQVCRENMKLYRILMSQPEGDLWHAPRRQVKFLSTFPPFEFGASSVGEAHRYNPLVNDRFTGTLWFVNRNPQDFVLSALALASTGKSVIRLSEIQHHFRYRTEIALIRQLMGRLGDVIDQNESLQNLKRGIQDYVSSKGQGGYSRYSTRKEGKSFFTVTFRIELK